MSIITKADIKSNTAVDILNTKFANASAVYKEMTGAISDITVEKSLFGKMLTASFNESRINITSAISKKPTITFVDSDLDSDFKTACADFYSALDEIEKDNIEKRKEKAALAEKEKEAEKYKKQIARKILAADNYITNATTYTDYETWIRDNITSIQAEVPDFLAKWFTTHFPEAEFTTVSNKVKTSGGYMKKWSISLRAKVKDPSSAPQFILDKMNDKNIITDTQFLFDLAINYEIPIRKIIEK